MRESTVTPKSFSKSFPSHSFYAVHLVSCLIVAVVCVRRSTQIKTYSWDNAQVLLVGNKCDMEDERVVMAERGRQLSESLGMYQHCQELD